MTQDPSSTQPGLSYYQDPSFARSDRVHRTHTDANKDNIAKMNWRSKLWFNEGVGNRNEKRRARRLIENDVSDVESFLSFDEEEVFEDMKNNSSHWDNFKKLLPTSLQILFSQRMIQQSPPGSQGPLDSTSSTTADPTLDTRQPKPDFIPLSRDDINSNALSTFPPQLLHLADHDFQIPLTWFTTKNQRWLASNMHTFKFTALTHSPDKPRVLDIEDVSKKMDNSPDAGPSREEDLRFEEWRTAMDNLLKFEVAVYKKESAARPVFLAEHMRFFDKPDAGESYPFWIGMEIRLRREHYACKVAFDRMTYVTEYSHCFKSWEDSKKAPVLSGRIPSSSSSSTYRHQPYPPKQPFPSSSNGTPPPALRRMRKSGPHTQRT
ncbi:hypothetical protein F5878DRAFT_657394 [Lentinula raphanica]|uniref:Uncharacterized protein n=1 Tax=Lentinula raphanica TaxID=153919 RepID=A0AA38UI50_9AGAR|nr:hypothetical protein F5878DRAFT_657394 [Lentinula raphanica]